MMSIAYLARSARPLLLAALLCGSGCDDGRSRAHRLRPSDTPKGSASQSAFGCAFPENYRPSLASSYVRGFEVKVHKDGTVTWNGSPISHELLAEFAGEVAKKPRGSSVITVRAEPGSACKVVNEVRGALRDREACSQQTCVEMDWRLNDVRFNAPG